ncbi:MAG: 30S ribosomal protein S12 methylthiotransferase RimO [Lachnospiraceae bacterium]|jgi:ribosomal protein S12 methylthiotransferase|nr:30S ribosomal protein S12 methylthiotransferase RimO [Lachnospiraceae bacterium]
MTVCWVSLGCDKNLVDSEKMLGFLRNRGFEFTSDEEKADVIAVNTCCFIQDAKEESILALLEAAKYKKTGNCKVLIAAGCMAVRYRDEIAKEIPEVDGIIGTDELFKVADIIEDTYAKAFGVNQIIDGNNSKALKKPERILTTPGYYAYIKIAEGCDKHCTYCIIPKIRGEYRSVPMEDIISEAKELVGYGVKELILVAQETTLYGVDLFGEKKLPELLRKLCEIKGLRWIRLLYCYPEEVTDELINVIKTEPKICKYIDLPIQHANDEILRKMGRKATKKTIVDLIEKLRSEIPEIVIRTSLITGFPQESEEAHEELLQFIKNMKFDRLGVFMYSAEEGTAAAKMKGQIPKRIKKRRYAKLMESQQEVSFKKSSSMVEKELDVLIEGELPERNVYVGRTYADAPDVDGLIFIESNETLNSGDFAKAKVIKSEGYDLIGELL